MPFVIIRFSRCELDDNWIFAEKTGTVYPKVSTWTTENSRRFRALKDQAGIVVDYDGDRHPLKFKDGKEISLYDNILCYNKEDISMEDVH